MTHANEKEAIWAVKSIEHGLLHLETFKGKRSAALPLIADIIAEIEDGGVDDRDMFRHTFWKLLWDEFIMQRNDE